MHVSDSVWAKQFYGYSGKQAQAIFATGIMVFSLVMIVAGRWQDRAGPRIVATTGRIGAGGRLCVHGAVRPKLSCRTRRRGRDWGRGNRLGICLPDRGVREMVS